MRQIIILCSALIVLLFILTGCKNNSKQIENKGLDKLNWMLGNWTGIMEEGIVTERWEKSNDTLFSGESFFIKGFDTLSRETISLQQQDSTIFYIPLVEGQNDNKPVYFKLTFSDGTIAVFENPGHDFPQKIKYQLINSDSLVATISGLQEGSSRSINFPMKRETGINTDK